jgi:hypothetical protein
MADPTIFSWRTIDRIGSVATPELYAAYDGSTETVDSLIGRWTATGALLDAATSSQILGGQITIPLQPDSGWKSAPASSGNKNNEVINLNFVNDANRFLTEFPLPAYLDSMISNGKVLLTQTDLAALITDIVLHGVGHTVFYNSRDFQQLQSVGNAFLTQRKRRGQNSRTRTLG